MLGSRVNKSGHPEIEHLGDELSEQRDYGSKKSSQGYALMAAQALRVLVRRTSLRALDASLRPILSFTESQSAVRPTISVTLSKEERAAIARSQRLNCMFRGARPTSENFQTDHMDPVSRGGPNNDENLQALCRPCNQRKGNHTDDEFRERYCDLVGGAKRPPPRTIPQREFVELMESTDANEGVREANRNRHATPKQRVERALQIPLPARPAVFLLASASMFEPSAVQVTLYGIAFAVGLWLRARHIGIFDRE